MPGREYAGMHPMKRPRRPVKKKPRKVVRKKISSRESSAESTTAAQAAIFDIPKPPPGLAYQWNLLTETELMLSEGWERVPYRQHKELPQSLNSGGYIVYRNNTLFQINAAIVHKALISLRLNAKAMEDSFYADSTREGRYMRIMPASFVVASDYDSVPDTAPPVPCGVTITFMAPARWQDAASALKLPLAEYARRRVVMGGHPMVPDRDGTFSPTEPAPQNADKEEI